MRSEENLFTIFCGLVVVIPFCVFFIIGAIFQAIESGSKSGCAFVKDLTDW